VKSLVPLAIPFLRDCVKSALGPGYVKALSSRACYTHDSEQAARYDVDPLIFRQIAVNMLLDLHDTSTRLLADAGVITAAPARGWRHGSDWVVKTTAQQKFVERASSKIKRFEELPGFSHAIFHEQNRALVFDMVRDCPS